MREFSVQALVCADKLTGAIGGAGSLLWDLPQEREAYLHRLIKNTIVVVGRKTAETLPRSRFQDHEVLVMSSDWTYRPTLGTLCESVADAVELSELSDKPLSVIGGAETYKRFTSVIDRFEVSLVDDPDSWMLEDVDGYFNLHDHDAYKKAAASATAHANGEPFFKWRYTSYNPIVDNGYIIDHGRWDYNQAFLKSER